MHDRIVWNAQMLSTCSSQSILRCSREQQGCYPSKHSALILFVQATKTAHEGAESDVHGRERMINCIEGG